MVKPLADILAEIEERQSIHRFYNGGDTPDDFGQDDTLGEEDEGAIEPSDTQGLEDAGVYDFYTPPPSIGPGSHHPRSEVDRGSIISDMEIGNEHYQSAVNEANLEQLGYIFQDPDYMKAVANARNRPGGGIWGAKDKQSFIDDTLGSKGFLEGFYNPSLASGLATLVGLGFGIPGLGSGVGKLEDMGKNPARSAMVQNLASKGFTPQQIQQSLAEMGVKGLDEEDITDLTEGVGKGDIETTQFGDLYRDDPPGWGEGDDNWIRPPLKPTTMIAEKMIEDVVPTTPGKGWSFDPNIWYSSAQGGPIETYQVGGLAGMMNRGMMDQRQQFNAQQGLQIDQQNALWNNYRSGNRPARPPQHGGFGLHDLPRPPQFPGFLGPFGPQRPPRPPQQPRLEPKTYFHEHEGGKVTYPNFPKPFVNPPDKPNNWKGGRQQIAAQPTPYQTHVQSIFDKVKPVDEAGMPEPYSPLEPVPPISISETTATAMEPEAVEEATQTTIEEARPVPREIDIQMPENVTATLDFPEDVRGTANYRRGGLAGILKSLIPYGIGFLGGPALGLGTLGTMGLGAGASYAMGGKNRNFLDAIKGGLGAFAGQGLAQLGAASFDKSGTSLTDPKTFGKLYEDVDLTNVGISDVGKGLKNLVMEGGMDAIKPAIQAAAYPIAAGVAGASLTPSPEMPQYTPQQVQRMTPEERRKYLEAQKAKYSDSPFMQPTVFAPPNVDIGWQPNYAAEGGVMEIDEEMESGSFVLPADVVSNVGDGSSDSGHRRLTELFGGGDEYALGGGIGILKGPVKGVGSGLDDLIQTGIDGVRVARLSSDEFVVPKDVVRRLGNGSQKAGSEKLYDFMKDVRLQKHGTGQQPKEIHMSGLRKMV